jgi:hypothetical protein
MARPIIPAGHTAESYCILLEAVLADLSAKTAAAPAGSQRRLILARARDRVLVDLIALRPADPARCLWLISTFGRADER